LLTFKEWVKTLPSGGQNALAKTLRVSRQQVNHWASGNAIPPKYVLKIVQYSDYKLQPADLCEKYKDIILYVERMAKNA